MTYMMSIVDLVVIDIDTSMQDTWCSLDKKFTNLIHMGPLIEVH